MCSNSRNGVPRVAQRYRTIAAHTRHRASVLVVFVVFCVHMHSFAGLIRRTPPPTFSDTEITDRHSDTTIFQPAQSSLGADILVYWIGKIVRTCAPGGSRTLDFLRARRAPYPLGQALRYPVTVCVFQFSSRRSPSGSAVQNHCRTHPAPCVRPRCVCSVLRAHAQFCRFDKADATADVQ